MQRIIQAVERSLLAGRGARAGPGGGRVQIDRLQPLLVVHRRRSAATDRATDKLVAHSASVLTFGEEEDVAELRRDDRATWGRGVRELSPTRDLGRARNRNRASRHGSACTVPSVPR